MTTQQAALVRFLLVCAAWAIGQLLATLVPFPLADFLIPAALAAGVYAVTVDLGRRPADANARYWRGRRIDDDDRGPRRWNQTVPNFTFDPLRHEDMPLARRWLLEPHVRRWWNDDPHEDDYPDGTIADWLTAVNGTDPTDMFLIKMDGKPIGVMQSYRVDSYPDYVAELGELPEPAFSLDVFIGEASLVGKGVGPDLLRAFLRIAFVKYGLDYCVIGPARSNVAAIRAYEKVGFRYLKDYREEDTRDPDHVLLDLRLADLR